MDHATHTAQALFFDPRQNFIDPRHLHHQPQNLTHATLEATHPSYLAESYKHKSLNNSLAA